MENITQPGGRTRHRKCREESIVDGFLGTETSENAERTYLSPDVLPKYIEILSLESHLKTGTSNSENLDEHNPDFPTWYPETTSTADTESSHFQVETWREALYHGSIENIRYWLEKHFATKPARLNRPIAEEDQCLPLHVVALRGSDYTKILLDAGADVNCTSSSHGTALQWAASTGDLKTVKLLLDHGAAVNAKAGWKGTALIAAVQARKPSIVELLLQHHADPEQLDLYRFTSALSAATDFNSIRLLLENGADVHNKTRDTHVLAKAVAANDTAIVQLLLDYGVDPNMRLKDKSLLDCAVSRANAAIAESLLEHGATAPSNDSGELLAVGAMDGRLSPAKQLIVRGIKPNSQGEKYGSPLTAAASKGDIDMITRLLEAGADINLFHKVDGSPLLAALLASHWDAVLFLLQRGAEIPDPHYWKNNNEVPQFLRLWRNAVLEYTYGEFGEFMRDFNDANNSIRIANVTFPWKIPSMLELAPKVRMNSEDFITKSLENHLVLVRWSATDDDGNEILRTKATTCFEYVQRRWGSLGRQLLRDITRVAFYDTYELVKCAYQEDGKYDLFYAFNIDPASRNVCLSFDYNKSSKDAPILDLISAIDWICRALRTPLSDDVMVSSTVCQISRMSQIQQIQEANHTSTDGPILGIQLTIRLSKRPLVKTNHDCWHQLFKSIFVIEVDAPAVHDDDPKLKDDNSKRSSIPFGKGLELSFDLMAALAAVEFPVIVEKGVVLVGYHTVLIPTEIEKNYVQFHLEVSQEAQINPHTLSYGSRSLISDYRQFKSKRCFVGWCERAHIMLGTRLLSAGTVRYTNSQEKRKTLHLVGLSAGVQAMSCSPIQAGITGQANFSFVTNKVSFTPSTVYTKMLRNTAKEVALIYDATAKRSWLVPKLSMLLHMVHVWVKENIPPGKSYEIDVKDPVPFADPHYDGLEIVEAFEDAGDIVLCGEGEDAFRLRSLLLGLNINLLQVRTATETGDSRTLYGYEMMDVIIEPGKGSVMKKISLLGDGRSSNWARLANIVDSVIVCSDIGSAIMPVESAQRRSALCNCLPCGFDFLAAHISCIAQLTKRAGGQLAPTTTWISEINLDHSRCWNFTGDPFKSCNHDNKSRDTCWETPNLFQKIGRIGQSRNCSQQLEPKRMCLPGAVVFGERFRR